MLNVDFKKMALENFPDYASGPIYKKNLKDEANKERQ